MDDSIVLLREAFRGINTGRVRSALLDPIRVEAYGNVVPLSHVAFVGGGRKARSLTVTPHDPSLLGKIQKAIFTANLGLNPQKAGTTIMVSVPQPDDDQRKRLESRAKSLSEQQRVAVRNIRKDVRNRAKREDRLKQIQKPLEALTKRKINEIDTLLKAKVGEIHWRDPRWNK
jgi:ribosome recycling factor